MGAKVSELRISHIQFERFGSLVPDNAPFGFMPSATGYCSKFKSCLQSSNNLGYGLPWKTVGKYWERNNRFWLRYLRYLLDDVNRLPREAWDNLVPFRLLSFGSSTDRSLAIEGYIYPHGIGVVVNHYVKFGTGKTFIEAAQLAGEEVNNKTWIIDWSHGIPSPVSDEGFGIESIIKEALNRLSDVALGYGSRPSLIPCSRFAVSSVIGGSVDGDTDWNDTKCLHHYLGALCPSQSWGQISNGSSRATIEGCDSGKILYLLKEEKVVWFPATLKHVTAKNAVKKRHKLTCYHRNLIMATLQTESLYRFLCLARETPPPLPDNLDTMARAAARQLGLLYIGCENTYTSWAIHHQIESRLDEINAIVAAELPSQLGIPEDLWYSKGELCTKLRSNRN